MLEYVAVHRVPCNHAACPYGVDEENTLYYTRNRTWLSLTLQHTPTHKKRKTCGQRLHTEKPRWIGPYRLVTLYPHICTDSILSNPGSYLTVIGDYLSGRQLHTRSNEAYNIMPRHNAKPPTFCKPVSSHRIPQTIHSSPVSHKYI